MIRTLKQGKEHREPCITAPVGCTASQTSFQPWVLHITGLMWVAANAFVFKPYNGGPPIIGYLFLAIILFNPFIVMFYASYATRTNRRLLWAYPALFTVTYVFAPAVWYYADATPLHAQAYLRRLPDWFVSRWGFVLGLHAGAGIIGIIHGWSRRRSSGTRPRKASLR